MALTGILETTVQRLVGGSGPFAPAATSHGGSDATSGVLDASGHAGDASPAADATSGASLILRLGKVGTKYPNFFHGHLRLTFTRAYVSIHAPCHTYL